MKDDYKTIPDSLYLSKTTMSIGIAAPSSVPFVVGGAEKLWWGLQEYINKNTVHHCELIKLCAPENNFRDLVSSYDRFYRLDLRHFDLVLTSKYPAWMVRHPNHHVYYQHPLRGLYELYRGPETLSRKVRGYPGVKKILNAVARGDVEVRRLLDDALELAHDPMAPEEAMALPGPLLRKIVHTLDHHAIRRLTRVSAISETVRNRSSYFPDADAICVIHHPSNLQGFHDAGRDYLLTASRLVHSKRIHLIVKAYMDANLDIPLKIAGRGPELPVLQKMAGGNRNIEFTGFVSDRDLVELYSRALAVVFVPDNEDLGLITLEAMHSGKPVITCNDSGGSTELVRNGQTGWICTPDATDLGRAMKEAVADLQKTADMGYRAREQVREVSWENLINSLFSVETPGPEKPLENPLSAKSSRGARPMLTVLSTFPVYPPRGGGQSRIYHLYRTVATDFDVNLVSLGAPKDRAASARIAPGFRETRIPMPEAFFQKSIELENRLGISAVDLAVMLYPALLPEMADAVANAAKHSGLVIFSHPYTLPLAEGDTIGKRVYEAHNVEYDIKKAVLDNIFHNDAALKRLKEIEQAACDTSVCTMACSDADIRRLCELYGLDPKRALLIPNGVDTSTCVFTSPAQKKLNQEKLGIRAGRIAVFIGSYHPPNIQAVKYILDIAASLHNFCFIIIGSVSEYFKFRPCPENVGFTGEIPDAEKTLYLSCADVALNPVVTGSGTNLKMIEYIASGLPVVSTHFGARGLDISFLPVRTAAIGDFAAVLDNFDDKFVFKLENDRSELVRSGREMMEKNYCWDVIGRKLSKKFIKIVTSG